MTQAARHKRVSFGDNVRVRSTPLTVERGLAGARGQVFGETKPSVTDVEVIGASDADFAINVNLADKGQAYWFAEELLELLDHAPGTEIRLNGIEKKWTRTADGEWREEPADATPAQKPWWRFW